MRNDFNNYSLCMLERLNKSNFEITARVIDTKDKTFSFTWPEYMAFSSQMRRIGIHAFYPYLSRRGIRLNGYR